MRGRLSTGNRSVMAFAASPPNRVALLPQVGDTLIPQALFYQSTLDDVARNVHALKTFAEAGGLMTGICLTRDTLPPQLLNYLPRWPDGVVWAWATRRSAVTRSQTDWETTADEAR
jgi:hypothetical protein